MDAMREIVLRIVGERPVGSAANGAVAAYFEEEAERLGYDVLSLPFACDLWRGGPSVLRSGGAEWTVSPGPFSRPFDGAGAWVAVSSFEALSQVEIGGKIVLLHGEIAKEPLMPKEYPFYYPDEHRQVIELLEGKHPAALVAATAKHPTCGLDPFPLFDDGNFLIPTAYISAGMAAALPGAGAAVELHIDSLVTPSFGRQPMATLRAKGRPAGRMIVCAHMDSAYNAPGAMDNAVGVAALLGAMRTLACCAGALDVDFVPFNGEEHYAACGELAYLEHIGGMDGIRLAVNVDSPGHIGSATAVSAYNLDGEAESTIGKAMKRHGAVAGEPWAAGDHAVFAFRGIPSVAVTSSDMMNGVMGFSHTPRDTVEQVDFGLVGRTVAFLAELVGSFTA